jgi:hypothetical protein
MASAGEFAAEPAEAAPVAAEPAPLVVAELVVRGDMYQREQLDALSAGATQDALNFLVASEETTQGAPLLGRRADAVLAGERSDWPTLREGVRRLHAGRARQVEELSAEHVKPANFFDHAGEDSVESVMEDLLANVAVNVAAEYQAQNLEVRAANTRPTALLQA